MSDMKTLTIGARTWSMPVTSVNGQTGAVVLDASDVGAATEQDIADAIIQVLPVDSASGAVASFPDGYPAPAGALSCAITPVQDLHGQSSPYPAGGGKNKYDPDNIEQGGFKTDGKNDDPASADHGNRIRSTNFIPVTAGQTYTLSFTGNNASLLASMSFYASADYTISRDSATGWEASPTTFTVPSGSNYCRMIVKNDSGTAITPTAIKNIQLETGATATSFAPYSNLCPITGWSEAKVWCESTYDPTADPKVTIDLSGTRYGGTLDVKTGVLTVTMANIASYAGETIGEPWLSSMDAYVPGATPTTGAQVVYTLSTPLTVQLTAEEVRTLLGQNNVWANCGDVSVSYRADIQLYIEKKLS